MTPPHAPPGRSAPSCPAPSPPTARIRQRFAAWRAGDERAGEALFRELRAMLHMRFRSHPPHVVDDLVQETLVACVLARRSIRCEEAFMGYVHTVARRIPIHQARQRSRLAVVELDERTLSDDLSPGRLDRSLEARRLLDACRSPLTRLVELRYLHGHHGVELARALQISEASVRRRLRRGLAQLRASAGRSASDT